MPAMTARLAVVLAATSRAAFHHGCDHGITSTGVICIFPGEGVPRHLHDITSVLQVNLQVHDVEPGGDRNPTWAPSNLTYRLPNTSEALSGPPFLPAHPAHMLGQPPRAPLAQNGPSPGKHNALVPNGLSSRKPAALAPGIDRHRTSSNVSMLLVADWAPAIDHRKTSGNVSVIPMATSSHGPSPLTVFVTVGRLLLACFCSGILISYGFCRPPPQGRLLAQEQPARRPSRLRKSSGKDHPPLCEEECCTRPPSMQWVDCQIFEESSTAKKNLTNASLHRLTLAVGDAIMGAAALVRQEPEAREDETVIPEMRMRLNEIPNWNSLPSSSKQAMRDALRSSAVLSSALQEVVPDNHTVVLEAALCIVFDDGATAKSSDEGLIDGAAK